MIFLQTMRTILFHSINAAQSSRYIAYHALMLRTGTIMKSLLKLKTVTVKIAGLALVSSLMAAQAFAGWTVSGTQVRDPNGNNFIYRGINHPHSWYTSRLTQSLKDIAATGANSVRVVLSNGTQPGAVRNNGADVTNVIAQCKANKLVCVLEVHDSTGYGDNANATNISVAAAYWVSSDIKAAITGQENFVIVNIANEPTGNAVSTTTYVNETKAAIQTIRNAGLTHQIMIDGATWGQDWSFAMRDNAAAIFAADTLRNIVFSVHMYEVYGTATAVLDYMNSFQAKGFALIVGEFGTSNNGNNVDEASIMQYAQQKGIGYIGWSWSGNGSCCIELDIVNSFTANSYTTWGNYLINSTNGIKATSKLATNFTGGTAASSVRSSTAAAASSKAATSVAAGTGTQCNWYGTTYPICTTISTGWGWENGVSCVGRTDCAALPSPYGVIGTAAASSKPATSTAASSKAASVAPASSKAASSTAGTGTGSVSCAYVVSNSWATGFTGAIRVTNNGTAAKSGWTATWQYAGANRITSSWNATVTGANPYSATNLSWNGSIAAGQSVEFGFQGNKNGGAVEMPAVTCK
jgi:mannan endo-1,4-beta-mannosidase